MPRLRRTGAKATVVAAFLVVSAACQVTCQVTSVDATTDGDGGLDGGSLDKATCPSGEPEGGSTCLLPSGTTCQFGACGTRIARCDRAVWVFAENPAPRPPCPKVPPAEDDPCPACWPTATTCTYAPESCSPPDAGDGGATPNTSVASCVEGVWKLAFFPCVDSGADVQRDADADAD